MVNWRCNFQRPIHWDKLGHQSVSRSIKKEINIAQKKAILHSNNSLISSVRLKMMAEGGEGPL